MPLSTYQAILRKHWRPLLGVPLLIIVLSLVGVAVRPASYRASTQLLLTRSAEFAGNAGLTPDNEDKTAADLPAIVAGAPFRADLAAALAGQGQASNVAPGALSASSVQHSVTLLAQAATPAEAEALVAQAVRLLQTNGLRYWGETRAGPGAAGLNIVVLEAPGPAIRTNGPREIVLEVGLRALAGLLAVASLVLIWETRTTHEAREDV